MGALKDRVEAEPYWFHQIELGDGVVTPGWSNPARDKLPLFGLPDDMTGMRVLDVRSKPSGEERLRWSLSTLTPNASSDFDSAQKLWTHT